MAKVNTGKLFQVPLPGCIRLVPMNETRANLFSEFTTVGTVGLGGCFLIAIASPKMCIMSHAGPLAAMTAATLVQLVEAHRLHAHLLDAGSTVAWVLVGKLKSVLLLHLVDSIRDTVRGFGLEPQVAVYDASDRGNRRGQGSAYVELELNVDGASVPRFFFEDRKLVDDWTWSGGFGASGMPAAAELFDD